MQLNREKINIALLAGGTSPERAVSKSSGAAIYSALLSLGYNVKVVDPAYGLSQPEDPAVVFAEGDYAPISNRNYVDTLNSNIFDNIDLVFLALHGRYGEDGTIQSLLELRGLKYTGSNVLASSLAMDKIMSKILFRHYGIPTPEWFSIEKGSAGTDSVSKMIERSFGFPCVIKPNDQGSTVGLTVCGEAAGVEDALSLALGYSDKALIEEYISGREMTVAVVENKAFPVLEIKPKHELYDYECKYTSGMSEYQVPAEIPKDVFEELQQNALKAFNSLGCSGYGRVDFRLDQDNKIYCLEVNTLPGMTATSLVPKMAKAVGITFEQLVEKIIILSL